MENPLNLMIVEIYENMINLKNLKFYENSAKPEYSIKFQVQLYFYNFT